MKVFRIMLVAGFFGYTVPALVAETKALRLVQTIPLPNVEGRIDHFGVDVQGQRLFVAALENNTLEVIDLRECKRLTTITELKEPQGILFVPGTNKLFVANTVDGTCRMFNGTTYKPLGIADFSSDADNIRYDAANNHVYVGYGEGALGILDAATGQKLGDIALRGHPESFRLETSGPRIFVNVPSANHTIAVGPCQTFSCCHLDRGRTVKLPYDLRRDQPSPDRRYPPAARLIVLNTQTGKSVARQPAVGDSDDVFMTQRIGESTPRAARDSLTSSTSAILTTMSPLAGFPRRVALGPPSSFRS